MQDPTFQPDVLQVRSQVAVDGRESLHVCDRGGGLILTWTYSVQQQEPAVQGSRLIVRGEYGEVACHRPAGGGGACCPAAWGEPACTHSGPLGRGGASSARLGGPASTQARWGGEVPAALLGGTCIHPGLGLIQCPPFIMSIDIGKQRRSPGLDPVPHKSSTLFRAQLAWSSRPPMGGRLHVAAWDRYCSNTSRHVRYGAGGVAVGVVPTRSSDTG